MSNFIAMVSIVAALHSMNRRIQMEIRGLRSLGTSDAVGLPSYTLYVGVGSNFDGRYTISYSYPTGVFLWQRDADYIAPSGPGVWGGFEYGS